MTVETQSPSLAGDPGRGGPLLALLLGAKTWIHRRVDSITLGASGTTRRSMSFDVTIPSAFAIRVAGRQVLVPLALIEKGAVRKVDTEDPIRASAAGPGRRGQRHARR